MDVYIYGLIDPRDRRIKYVGQTVDFERRHKQHCDEVGDTAKCVWVGELRDRGLSPDIVQLEVATQQAASYKENWWIQVLRANGEELTNTAKPTRDSHDFTHMLIDRVLDDSVERQKFLATGLAAVAALFMLVPFVADWPFGMPWYLSLAVTVSIPLSTFVIVQFWVSVIPMHLYEVPGEVTLRSLWESYRKWENVTDYKTFSTVRNIVVLSVGIPIAILIMILTGGLQ